MYFIDAMMLEIRKNHPPTLRSIQKEKQ